LKDTGDPYITEKYILDVYLKMLESSIPDYNPRHIQGTIGFLYALDNLELKDKCDQVCNIYGSNGKYFL